VLRSLYLIQAPPLPLQRVQERTMSFPGVARFIPSPLATVRDLSTTHCPEYIERYISNRMTPRENRVVGFPWTPANVKRTLSSVGGTVAATHDVCRREDHDGSPLIAGHIAGGQYNSTLLRTVWRLRAVAWSGTHHAFRDYGEGFCVFSDIAVPPTWPSATTRI
jgi:acetoin utilization deacetylase AcuC-like enzyme